MVAPENEVTFDYLSNIPYRKQLKDRLSELWNYEKISAPFTKETILIITKTMVCKTNM